MDTLIGISQILHQLAGAGSPTCYSLSKHLLHEHSTGTVVVPLNKIEAEPLIELKGLCLLLFIGGIKSDLLVTCNSGKI